MLRRFSFSVVFFWCTAIHATSFTLFSQDSRNNQGQTSFKGQIIASTCTLYASNIWQESESIKPREIHLQMHNCGLTKINSYFYTENRFQISFNVVRKGDFSESLASEQINSTNLQPQNSNIAKQRILLSNKQKSENIVLLADIGNKTKKKNHYTTLYLAVDYE